MLTSLAVSNFRSLRDVKVKFSASGLTVIVGANGTGKSNLIKCLEFLGTIPREGLENTIRANNGADAILPKALSMAQCRATEVKFTYTVDLPRIDGYPADGPAVQVAHELSIQALDTRRFINKEERLLFSEPLLVQAAINAAAGLPHEAEVPPSWLLMQSELGGEVSINGTPPIGGRHLGGYLEWLGFPFLKPTFEKLAEKDLAAALKQLLRPTSVGRNASDLGERRLSCLVDPNGPAMLLFSSHARAFKEFMSGIRRFDLQLSQLRKQQDISSTKELLSDGRGLPAAVRNLKAHGGESGDWRRLALTLAELAPHVSDTSISQLKSGQEFVQFIESRTGRPVESWQSSDGTLRALAILLAVETHPSSGTILIEEPEQGLHPWAVRSLVLHLRRVIAERRIQVILTTHSQQVLDSVEPSEVLVASRSSSAVTHFRTISEITGSEKLEVGELGRMWVSGVLGGVPSYE